MLLERKYLMQVTELDQTYNKLDKKKKKKSKNSLAVDLKDFGSVLSQIQSTNQPSEPFVRGAAAAPTPNNPLLNAKPKPTSKKARKAAE
jgi:penicillin V acylase-like amidase (Ntn superfamily)